MPDTRLAASFDAIEHVWVPLADGVRLSARIWLPSEWRDRQTPVPAILEYIPYRKRDMVRSRDERNHPYFASNGYACVRVDMRGSGDSEGCFTDMYSDAELSDLHEVLAWISAQPWCDGALGMMGTSWGGTSALQAAAGSPLLRAVIAVCATDNRYEDDIHHMGGCLLTDTIEWGASLPAIIALPQSPEAVPDGWREAWRERLESLAFPLQHWIEHETRDDYWRHGSVSEHPGAIKCPVLAVGGWSDRYSNTVMNLIEQNPQTCWGIIGPWGHHYPDVGIPGPALDFQREALRWWDRWLKHDRNGAEQEPRLRAWCSDFQSAEDVLLQRHGEWIGEASWPADSVAAKEFNLTSDDIARDPEGFARVPDHLSVGRQAGDTGYFGRPGGLPLDQAEDDACSLLFETAVLDAPVQMLGKARISLDIRLSERRSIIVIRLSDVAPNGEVSRVCFAVKNLALDCDFLPRNPAPGKQAFRETITFPNSAHRFAAGHKIRVAISTSYWPLIWPSPHISQLLVNPDTANFELPCRKTRGEDSVPFTLAEKKLEANPAQRPTGIERVQIEDPDGDSIRHRWNNPFTEVEYAELGLVFGAQTSAEYQLSYRDPASAQSSFEHRLQTRYHDHEVCVIGRASLSSSATHYYPQVSIRVWLDNAEFFSRDWSCSIERKYS